MSGHIDSSGCCEDGMAGSLGPPFDEGARDSDGGS